MILSVRKVFFRRFLGFFSWFSLVLTSFHSKRFYRFTPINDPYRYFFSVLSEFLRVVPGISTRVLPRISAGGFHGSAGGFQSSSLYQYFLSGSIPEHFFPNVQHIQKICFCTQHKRDAAGGSQPRN